MSSYPVPTAEQAEAIKRITDKLDVSMSSTIMEEAGVLLALGRPFLIAFCKKNTTINSVILNLSMVMIVLVFLLLVISELFIPLGVFACFILAIILFARKKTIDIIKSSKKDVVIASGYWKDNEKFFFEQYKREDDCSYSFKEKVVRLAELFDDWDIKPMNLADIGSLFCDLNWGKKERDYQEKLDKIGVTTP